MKKKFMAAMLVAVMAFALAACGSSEDYSAITTDADAGTVTINAAVNGLFCDESTMHGIVFEGGSQGDAAMFAAFCDSQDFYDALVEVGASTDQIKQDKIAEGEFITGQPVEITLTWEGQEEPVLLQDMIVCSEGTYKPEFVFGGDKGNNADAGSGCITCLNSCWAGIISNAAYPFNYITSGKMSTTLNKDIAPADGTIVQITFTLK